MIECDRVTKSIGGELVLDEVTCAFPGHRLSLLIGPSGSGKTILLRHLTGALRPDFGDIRIDRVSVPHLKEQQLLEYRRTRGVIFQGHPALFSGLSVYDNVAFPLRQLRKLHPYVVNELVMDALHEVGLADAARKLPEQLSSGMKTRAAFARATILKPRVLLFDAPETGVDAVRTELLVELLNGLKQSYAPTAVVATHAYHRLFRVADHIVVMDRGRVVEEGDPSHVLSSTSDFVEQFLQGSRSGPLGMA